MMKILILIPIFLLIISIAGSVIVEQQKTNIILQTSITVYNNLKSVFGICLVASIICTIVFGIIIAIPIAITLRAKMAEKGFIEQRKARINKSGVKNIQNKDEVINALDSLNDSLQVFTQAAQSSSSSYNIRNAILELIDILHGTADYITDNPDQLNSMRQFLNYYIPTTTKYLKTYIDLVKRKRNTESKNITKTLAEIENIVCEMTELYKTAYDDLFSEKAMDVLAEIAVTKQLLERDLPT